MVHIDRGLTPYPLIIDAPVPKKNRLKLFSNPLHSFRIERPHATPCWNHCNMNGPAQQCGVQRNLMRADNLGAISFEKLSRAAGVNARRTTHPEETSEIRTQP